MAVTSVSPEPDLASVPGQREDVRGPERRDRDFRDGITHGLSRLFLRRMVIVLSDFSVCSMIGTI